MFQNGNLETLVGVNEMTPLWTELAGIVARAAERLERKAASEIAVSAVLPEWVTKVALVHQDQGSVREVAA